MNLGPVGPIVRHLRPILFPDRALRVPGRFLRRDARDRGHPFPERCHTPYRRHVGPAGPPRPRGAVAFGVLGAIVGNQIGYWVGHRAGRELVLTWGRYVKLTPGRLERVEQLFARHGGKAVFAGRFFSVSRVLEALVAGTSRMRWGTFVF